MRSGAFLKMASQKHIHGLKNKSLPYEESSGIPLIVRVPGCPAGVVTDALVSGVDFFPTCLDWTGLAPMAQLPGTNFAPLCRGATQALNGPVFAESQNWKMVRVGDTKLVVEGDDYAATQLYDLESDLYEMSNLVSDPSHAAGVATLRQHIVDWQNL